MQYFFSKNLKLQIEHIPLIILMVVSFARLIYFINTDDNNLIQLIPDDAFYYLKLSDYHHRTGLWTFDGINPTSGFHIIYAYILSVLFFLIDSDNWRLIFAIISSGSVFLYLASVLLIMKSSHIFFGKNASVFIPLFFMNPELLKLTTFMMESQFTLFFSAILFYFEAKFINDGDDTALVKNIIFVLVTISAVLSRSDLILLIISFAAFNFFFSKCSIKCNFNIAFIIGAVFGLLIQILHNYVYTGKFFQDSAIIKKHWSQSVGNSFWPVIDMVKTVFSPYFHWLILFLFFLITVRHIFYVRVFLLNKKQIIGFLISLIILSAYIISYRFNSQALMPWYMASLATPLALIFSGILGAIFFSKKYSQLVLSILTCIYLYAVPKSFKGVWDQQVDMMQAGKAIAEFSLNSKIGSWNSGILGYFSRDKIVNIDGLVNTTAVDYILRNDLNSYLKISGIKYIADYEAMINNDSISARGGYSVSWAQNCLSHKLTLAEPVKSWNSGRLVLWEINPICLL